MIFIIVGPSYLFSLIYLLDLQAMNTKVLQPKSTNLSFDNTEIAFAHLSNEELKQSHWLFGLMGKPWLVRLGTKLTPWAIKAGLPIKGLIRKTIFRHFVGGETM